MVSLSGALLLTTTVVTLNLCDAANILCIFPTASFSHQQPLLAVSRALAARGHNMTVINTNPNKTPLKNYRDIDIGFMYKEWDELKKQHGVSLQERISPFQLVSTFKHFVHFFCQKINLTSHNNKSPRGEAAITSKKRYLIESKTEMETVEVSEVDSKVDRSRWHE
ncbi:hypothetical protein LSTR_LSTR011761 [Laodelphax striatellus]|uniref:UDP-glycosyltransferase n=1 Tax=Laodelphax striatellus TaxID=195883 RepID=A0A482WLW3_LAOST|nr:hypothetical protein LSTR_LSTR011761 [Laodelphax striatellus]